MSVDRFDVALKYISEQRKLNAQSTPLSDEKKSEFITPIIEYYLEKYNVKSKLIEQVCCFMRFYSGSWDDTHNYIHIDRVVANLCQILSPTLEVFDYELILIVTVLHEMFDSKYHEKDDACEHLTLLLDGIINDSEKTKRIISIVENVSYSKEVKGLRKELGFLDMCYLNYVSDADRLDAIGKNGLERCLAYTRSKNPDLEEWEIKKKARDHFDEKLNRLVSDGRFHTERGTEIAQMLHDEMDIYKFLLK